MRETIFGMTVTELTKSAEKIARHSEYCEDGSEKTLLELCAAALQMIQGATDLDSKESYFARHYASDFREALSATTSREDFSLESIFWLGFYLYALILENCVTKQTFTDLESRFLAFFTGNISAFSASTQRRIDYLRIGLTRDLLRFETVKARQTILDLASKEKESLQSIVQKVEEWDSKLESYSKKSKLLEENLRNSYERLNFVGLSNAFSMMIAEKNTERIWQLVFLTALGVLLAIIPFGLLIASALTTTPLVLTLDLLPKALPLLVLELVLLYYFRIFLHNYYSAKAQLLQLKFRYNICAFIQGYAEFAEKMRSGNDDRLFEKFEALIFSSIAPDPKNIPSHFDGIDQVAKLIREIKQKN